MAEWYSTLRSTDGLASFPVSNLPHQNFLDLWHSRTDPASTQTVTETVTVPSTGLVSLLGYVLDPSISGNFTATRDDDSNVYTVVAFTKSVLGATDVAILPGSNHIAFNTAESGKSVTITYKAAQTSIDAAYVARLHAEIVAIQENIQVNTFTATAGEAIDAQFVYLDDDKLYVASAPSVDFPAQYFCPGDYEAGEEAVIYKSGIVTCDVSMPDRVVIWAGRNGKPTWSGDGSANALVSGDSIHPAGYRWESATQLNLSVGFAARLA